MLAKKILNTSFNALLSQKTKESTERVILGISIFSYLVHLLLIFLSTQGLIALEEKFFQDPIAAIYTPFTFILVYEVYLLVYFLPKSTTIYIGKQYEIITLIVIRRIFKDIAYVELTSDWFRDKNDLQFTFDVVTALILFYILYLFYRKIKKREYKNTSSKVTRFVTLKKSLAVLLVPALIALAVYTFSHWIIATIDNFHNGLEAFKTINNVFFDEFFTLMIIVDVLLLLASFFYSHQFHKIIRNSGFIISTILIKISFLADGILNNILILSAVAFGFLILIVHNLYETGDAVPEQ
ncbi:MAG: hypothetical protein AAF740_11170 [Bacteroidota bacterium]